MQTKRLLTVRDVMDILNVSRRTIYYWIEDGLLKAVKIGSIYRFHPEDIDRLIAVDRQPSPTQVLPRILAIDDDVLIRESFKPLLERNGFKVKVAGGGHEALGLLREEDFDLILTDMRMPQMNGLETLKAIRKLREEQGKAPLPEIIVTGYEDSQVMAEAKAIGVRDFVMKPFDIESFFTVLRKNVEAEKTQACTGKST